MSNYNSMGKTEKFFHWVAFGIESIAGLPILLIMAFFFMILPLAAPYMILENAQEKNIKNYIVSNTEYGDEVTYKIKINPTITSYNSLGRNLSYSTKITVGDKTVYPIMYEDNYGITSLKDTITVKVGNELNISTTITEHDDYDDVGTGSIKRRVTNTDKESFKVSQNITVWEQYKKSTGSRYADFRIDYTFTRSVVLSEYSTIQILFQDIEGGSYWLVTLARLYTVILIGCGAYCIRAAVISWKTDRKRNNRN